MPTQQSPRQQPPRGSVEWLEAFPSLLIVKAHYSYKLVRTAADSAGGAPIYRELVSYKPLTLHLDTDGEWRICWSDGDLFDETVRAGGCLVQEVTRWRKYVTSVSVPQEAVCEKERALAELREKERKAERLAVENAEGRERAEVESAVLSLWAVLSSSLAGAKAEGAAQQRAAGAALEAERAARRQAAEELQTERRERQEAAEKLAAALAEWGQLREQLQEQLQEQGDTILRLRGEHCAIAARSANAEVQLRSLSDELQRVAAEGEAAREREQQLQEQLAEKVAQHQDAAAQLTADLRAAQQVVDDERCLRTAAEAFAARAEASLTEAERQQEAARAEAEFQQAELRAELSHLSEELSALREQSEAAAEECEALRGRAEQAEERAERAEGALAARQSELAAALERSAVAEDSLERLTAEHEALLGEVADWNASGVLLQVRGQQVVAPPPPAAAWQQQDRTAGRRSRSPERTIDQVRQRFAAVLQELRSLPEQLDRIQGWDVSVDRSYGKPQWEVSLKGVALSPTAKKFLSHHFRCGFSVPGHFHICDAHEIPYAEDPSTY